MLWKTLKDNEKVELLNLATIFVVAGMGALLFPVLQELSGSDTPTGEFVAIQMAALWAGVFATIISRLCNKRAILTALSGGVACAFICLGITLLRLLYFG